VTPVARKHVLANLWERVTFFRDNPRANPSGRFPDIRWIQLRESQLWVSNGELNALGDYLPDPTAYDAMTAEQLVPVLQRMRTAILSNVNDEFGLSDDSMEGAAESMVPGPANEVVALDKATAELGANRYQGLVARNACHFAPFSWQRWAEFHNQAGEEAKRHYQLNITPTPIYLGDTAPEEHEHQALVTNGYADHFIQDSFAAGHLVNKTLVMQWFVDYINSMSWIDRPWLGLPNDETMARMGSAQQPGVSGQDRYGHNPSSTLTSDEDRQTEEAPIDPQSAQERQSYWARMGGSGVSGTGAEQVANYQAYLNFLNSAFLQLSAKAAHDYFNDHGLSVKNEAGTKMRVGGDDTLLSKSDEIGAETTAQAAAMSRQAIDDLLKTGQTDQTVDAIMRLVPKWVVVEHLDGKEDTFGLADFQSEVIKSLCYEQLFPELVDSWKGLGVRMLGSEMVKGGVGGNAPASPMGDFPTDTGSTAAA
jgi:hypothetical protein